MPKTLSPTMAAVRREALDRAREGESAANYEAIYEGFQALGIPEADILPRVNVLTYEAWRAVGRHVRRGEHGVKVWTVVDRRGKPADPDEDEGAAKPYRSRRGVTVFHISQTDPDED